MSKYAGTQTEKNLEAAFAGESQARNKYTYFASAAKKEGYQQIAALFEKTAANEKEHAKMWFKELEGIGDTAANLADAAAGENYEWTDMYAGFAKTAEQNWELLNRLPEFRRFGRPILVGVADKRFTHTKNPSTGHGGSRYAEHLAARLGADILRVHKGNFR